MIIAEIMLGAVLGFINGLTGAGGAALALPGMVFLLGTSTVNAVATTFPFTAILRVVGSYQHLRQGSVNRSATIDLLLGSVPGTTLGVLFVSEAIDRYGQRLNDWLNVAIGLMLLLSILISQLVRRSKRASTPKFGWKGRNAAAVVLSFLTGIAVGATSVGGGSLLIVVMLLAYRIAPAEIVGTSIVVSLILMLIGTVGFWSEGLADVGLVLRLSIGAVPGVILGSVLTLRVSPRSLSQVLTFALVLAGVSLAARGALSLLGV